MGIEAGPQNVCLRRLANADYLLLFSVLFLQTVQQSFNIRQAGQYIFQSNSGCRKRRVYNKSKWICAARFSSGLHAGRPCRPLLALKIMFIFLIRRFFHIWSWNNRPVTSDKVSVLVFFINSPSIGWHVANNSRGDWQNHEFYRIEGHSIPVRHQFIPRTRCVLLLWRWATFSIGFFNLLTQGQCLYSSRIMQFISKLSPMSTQKKSSTLRKRLFVGVASVRLHGSARPDSQFHVVALEQPAQQSIHCIARPWNHRETQNG